MTMTMRAMKGEDEEEKKNESERDKG